VLEAYGVIKIGFNRRACATLSCCQLWRLLRKPDPANDGLGSLAIARTDMYEMPTTAARPVRHDVDTRPGR
jgi:hypothetical protein